MVLQRRPARLLSPVLHHARKRAVTRSLASTPASRQEAAEPLPETFSPPVIRPFGIEERWHLVGSESGFRQTGVTSLELDGPRLSDAELLARFRHAAARLLARQGELSINVHREGRTSMSWVQLPYVDLAAVVQPIEGTVTEAAHVGDSLLFDHTDANPLWRVRVGTDPETGKQYATFAFAHTLLDATGGVDISLDLFREAIAPRTVSDVPDFVSDFVHASPIVPPIEVLIPDLLSSAPPLPPAPASPARSTWTDRLIGGPTPEYRPRMSSLTIPPSTVNGLRKAASAAGLSVQALLYSTVHASLHALGLPDGTGLSSFTATNVRSLFPPELVGATNTYGAILHADVVDRGASFWGFARAYGGVLQDPAMRLKSAQGFMVPLNAVPHEGWTEAFLPGPFRVTTCVSNLGVVDAPASGASGLSLAAFKIWNTNPWIGQMVPAVSLRGGNLEITRGAAEGALHPSEDEKVDEAIVRVLDMLAKGEVLEGAKIGDLV